MVQQIATGCRTKIFQAYDYASENTTLCDNLHHGAGGGTRLHLPRFGCLIGVCATQGQLVDGYAKKG